MLRLQSSLKATVCLAAVALAAMGCSQDEWAHRSAQKDNITIAASVGSKSGNTRTYVDNPSGGQCAVLWNTGDVFGLSYTVPSQSPGVAPFTCSEGGDYTATFTGSLETGVTTSYAVYPYDKIDNLVDNELTMTLPATFDYTAASNGPMYADASNIDDELQFKHLAGLLKLTVSSSINTDARKFVITADNAIAGTCTADLSTNPAPFLTPANNGSKTITVNLSFTEEKTSTIFYIPIPVGEYTTLSAQLLDKEGKPLTSAKEWENVKVERAHMLTADFGFITIDASTGNLDDAIKNELPQTAPSAPVTTDLAISGTIDAENTSSIAIPILSNSNVNLTLTEIPKNTTTKPLELKDAANGTTPVEAVNTVTVAIPKVKAEETAPNLTITMPQTTVVLDAMGSEGTTYNKVTATTASNTLVIEKGVKVNKLIVKGGNVRVKGEIGSIEKDGELSTTTVYIIKETGAVLPNEIPEGFVVADPVAYDMQMAFAKGGEYVLTADASIIGAHITVPKENTVTLNLNGHTITAANKDGDNIVVNGKMTLKDTMQGTGKIVASEDYVENVYSTTLIYINGEDASFTMTGGTIEAVRTDPTKKGQYGVGVYDGGDFTMTGGKIEAGWYAVAGNGNYKTQNSVIKIEGGELISTADYAVYLPQAGTTTLSLIHI